MRDCLAVPILVVFLLVPLFITGRGYVRADLDVEETLHATVANGLKAEKVPLKTDDEAAMREERARSIDGHSTIERKQIKGEQKFGFQAEVGKLMKIISLYLYRNKEVFLRELISNASDAIDKVRFNSLTDPAVLAAKKDLEIRVSSDKENRTISIQDSGIGMTRDDLINNLGTIAQSGTQAFAQALEKGLASNLIGQFGVGFYSAYLVADRIVVQSKHNSSDKQYVWDSSDQSSFSVYEDPEGNTLQRGTKITLHLKSEPEMDEYLDSEKVQELIVRYSQFINFPIYLWSSHEVEKEVEVEEEEEPETEEEEEEEDSTEEEEEETDEKKTKTIKETVWDWKLVNTTKPLWMRNKKDIAEDEYNEFYKALSKDTQNPVIYIHFNAEGDTEFRSVLFLPQEPPYAQFDPSLRQRGVKLYVRRVFITDDFDTVIPKYLSFLKGVVDSDSLPLNISREQLQENKALSLIKKKIVRKAIAMFQMLAEDKDKYQKFWDSYGTNIKLGVIEDLQNKSRLSELLRFHSSKTGALTSFEEYVSRMKKGQEDIYFLSGSNTDELSKSPLLENLVKKGYEVLYMTDPIDEYVMQHLNKYDSKYKLTNLGKEGIKLNNEDEDVSKLEKETEGLRKYLMDNFSDRIGKVKVSTRLVSTPAVLVAESWGMTSTMERVHNSQTLGDKKAERMWSGKKVLEINPNHPLITTLRDMVDDKQDPRKIASLLLDSAAISSGYQVKNPSTFSKDIIGVLMNGLGIEYQEPEVTEEAIVEEEGEPETQQEERRTKPAKVIEDHDEL